MGEGTTLRFLSLFARSRWKTAFHFFFTSGSLFRAVPRSSESRGRLKRKKFSLFYSEVTIYGTIHSAVLTPTTEENL